MGVCVVVWLLMLSSSFEFEKQEKVCSALHLSSRFAAEGVSFYGRDVFLSVTNSAYTDEADGS